MTRAHWRIRLGREAESDFVRILQETNDKFGPLQVEDYRITLIAAVSALKAGPELPGSVSRTQVRPGLRSLHVARHGRRGRHMLLYRTTSADLIEIVRILHDAMDLRRHIPADLD